MSFRSSRLLSCIFQLLNDTIQFFGSSQIHESDPRAPLPQRPEADDPQAIPIVNRTDGAVDFTVEQEPLDFGEDALVFAREYYLSHTLVYLAGALREAAY